MGPNTALAHTFHSLKTIYSMSGSDKWTIYILKGADVIANEQSLTLEIEHASGLVVIYWVSNGTNTSSSYRTGIWRWWESWNSAAKSDSLSNYEETAAMSSRQFPAYYVIVIQEASMTIVSWMTFTLSCTEAAAICRIHLDNLFSIFSPETRRL